MSTVQLILGFPISFLVLEILKKRRTALSLKIDPEHAFKFFSNTPLSQMFETVYIKRGPDQKATIEAIRYV